MLNRAEHKSRSTSCALQNMNIELKWKITMRN